MPRLHRPGLSTADARDAFPRLQLCIPGRKWHLGSGIFGNMRTATEEVGRGKGRDVNGRFLAMASHYLLEPEFCKPVPNWERGRGKKNVHDARQGFCVLHS